MAEGLGSLPPLLRCSSGAARAKAANRKEAANMMGAGQARPGYLSQRWRRQRHFLGRFTNFADLLRVEGIDRL
jgi:hypothetical protein